MTSFLNTIVDTQRERVERSKNRVSPVDMEAAARSPELKPPLDFAAALKKPGIRVIAEIKKSSPSAGSIRPVCDPKDISTQYAVAGAAAISVVTEEKYFDGDIYNLITAREGAPSTPLLRKDFIVDIYQIFESRHFGADAVLLIKRILSDEEFRRLAAEARVLKMDVLAETRDEKELDAVLSSGIDCIVGVNSRNLDTFEVDASSAEKLLKKIPSSVTAVAESGIKSAEDIVRLKSARGDGATAFLIGSALMKHPSPGHKLSEIISAAAGSKK
jgi:indole-3-glycerol phosphate synthase